MRVAALGFKYGAGEGLIRKRKKDALVDFGDFTDAADGKTLREWPEKNHKALSR